MDIIICLDVSESMSYGEPIKIEQAKSAIVKIIESAPRSSNFTLIIFDSEAKVRVKNCDVSLLKKEINLIKTRGVSCLSAGLKTALELASDDSTLIFISDGRANLSLNKSGGFEGSLDLEKELLDVASTSKFGGKFHVIAVGEDSFTYTLMRLAEILGGSFHLAEDFEGLAAPPRKYQNVRIWENLTVYPAPIELPTAQPSWSKESQIQHVIVTSKNLYEDYLKYRRAFIINPLNNREARTAFLPVSADVLLPYRRRRPETASKIEFDKAVLVDVSYRNFLAVEKRGVVTVKLVKPIK